jgi:hypothetical protein
MAFAQLMQWSCPRKLLQHDRRSAGAIAGASVPGRGWHWLVSIAVCSQQLFKHEISEAKSR